MTDISNTRFPVNKDGVELKLPYFTSHTLHQNHPEIELAIFAFHGAGDPIADVYLKRVQDAAAMVSGASEKTLIVAPQIPHLEHMVSFFGAGNVPEDLMYFDDRKFWGGPSSNESAQISAFSVVDEMLDHICDSGHFPNLKRIVILGHSGGGQLVNRFAASSPFGRSGIAIRYIVMNPSSYVYFDGARVIPGTSDQFKIPTPETRRQIGACSNDDDYNKYNNYGYGLNNLYQYHQDNGINAGRMIDRYRSRNVIHMLGAQDNDPDGDGLDKKCGAMLQGTNRLERGSIYFNYLQYLFGPMILERHNLEVVPNADHSGRKMITSDIGVKYIFEDFRGIEVVSLADYIVIRDDVFSLRASQERTFAFDVPREIVRSGGSKKPIIAYFADPSNDAKNLKVMVEINDRVISDWGYSGGVGRGHWEVLTHENLNAGVENTIQFRVESGSGSVNISDVILWFQRDV